jgi:NAD(P)-dependent dehydrogenase (short-subunit alcohol dehydrogenase family)
MRAVSHLCAQQLTEYLANCRNYPLTSPAHAHVCAAELAPAFVYLACQESSYVTSETIYVTGGMPH